MTLHHNPEAYPYDYKDLPNVADLIDTIDWDILIVLDACRWDAFNAICTDAEPVCSPGKDTPTWTETVWCNTEYDWSDVTYISANPATKHIRTPSNDTPVIERHVKRHVLAQDDEVEMTELVDNPGVLTDIASKYDLPVVVHFLPPHTPYVGGVSCQVGGTAQGTYPDLIDGDFEEKTVFDLVEDGHVSPEFLRLCYLKNVELAWRACRELRTQSPRTIITADHGEILGPDAWGHVTSDNRTRVVPFTVTGVVDLPDPESVGASPNHEWVTEQSAHSNKNTSDRDSSPSPESRDVEAQLRALGYKDAF